MEMQRRIGKEPVKWAARATRHGPLISDVTWQRGQALALRRPSLDPGGTTMSAFMGINYARNWQEFRDALSLYVAPSQNFVFADVDGNIGYYGPGHIPIRARGDGSVPVPGWNDDYAWKDWIPFAQLPNAYNPANGYVVTANSRVTPDGYPYFITNGRAPLYRAERIIELLTAGQGLGQDMGKWRWGDLHRTVFAHNPFSQVSFLKPLFERGIITGGDDFTVNPSPYKLDAPFNSGWVPSYREIIDLADLGNSRFMHTTGQSGHFVSKHYDGLIPLWRGVQYVPMYWDKAQVSANSEGTLRLGPQ